jgi:hypothetical protein
MSITFAAPSLRVELLHHVARALAVGFAELARPAIEVAFDRAAFLRGQGAPSRSHRLSVALLRETVCSRRIGEPGFSETQPAGALNTSGFERVSIGGCDGGSGAFSAPGASGGGDFVISVSEDFVAVFEAGDVISPRCLATGRRHRMGSARRQCGGASCAHCSPISRASLCPSREGPLRPDLAASRALRLSPRAGHPRAPTLHRITNSADPQQGAQKR